MKLKELLSVLDKDEHISVWLNDDKVHREDYLHTHDSYDVKHAEILGHTLYIELE